ncbi:MAG: phospholipase B family protein [Bacteroidales bacterium]|nr:phospholipase B family protein [Bacteroidales bacterium]
MNRLFLSALVILSMLISCNSSSSKKTALSHEQILANATRSEKNGWIIIHLEGAPEVIGYQHGYLLANEIIDLRGAMEMLNEKTTGKSWDFYRNESYKMFWPKIPAEYREEINGISAGVNAKLGEDTIDTKDVVAMNSILEMAGYYVPWLENQDNPSPPDHCSAIAATGSWTTDGKIVIAHNNWSEYVIGERWNIIMDIVPEKGNRIIMDALPGFIHSGDDFNINSAGLIVTETTISLFKGFDSTGVAEFIRARKAIQYSSSIDEWVAIMEDKNNGGYANDWLIADNKTGEIARLELGLKNQFLERTKDGFFVGANFPVNEKLIKEETSFDPSSQDESPNMRRLRWDVLMKEYKGKINIESAKVFMSDHYDMLRKQEKAGRFSLCGHLDEDEAGTDGISWPAAYFPAGAVQAKATDSNLAKNMQLWAIIGHPCGQPFNAKSFLDSHPKFDFQKEFLRDMPGQVWTLFGKTTK